MDDEEITEVVQLTEKFVSILSGLLLNVAFAKIGPGRRQRRGRNVGGGAASRASVERFHK